jgi:hypothetical protein
MRWNQELHGPGSWSSTFVGLGLGSTSRPNRVRPRVVTLFSDPASSSSLSKARDLLIRRGLEATPTGDPTASVLSRHSPSLPLLLASKLRSSVSAVEGNDVHRGKALRNCAIRQLVEVLGALPWNIVWSQMSTDP